MYRDRAYPGYKVSILIQKCQQLFEDDTVVRNRIQ